MLSPERPLPQMTRREFLARAASAGGACAAAPVLLAAGDVFAGPPAAPAADTTTLPAAKANLSDHEAMFYEKLPDQAVACNICPRACRVPDGERGWCGVRQNRGGVYKTLVYGKICSAHVDPIEKKPMYHYLPGTTAFSVATAGCNFECKFCQNWEISQARPEQIASADLPPQRMVDIAKARNVPTLAFTYTEPTVFYEYMHDSAALARKAGVGSVMISNGFMQEKPLRQLCQHLTGVKVDFKACREKFYREICRGQLKPVQDTILLCKKIGIHLELVVLIVPTLNDTEEELKDLAKWVMDNVGPDVPLHFSRFTPMYRLKNLPPTPVKTLEQAHKIARDAGIHYVYLGNVPFHEANHTYCPKCGKLLIQRVGYLVRENHLTEKATCPQCGSTVPGVFTNQQAFAERNS